MLENLFTVDSLITFFILTALETVLGFDNLLYISIEAKKVDPARQGYVRKMGIFLAIGLRIVLLFAILQLVSMFEKPFYILHFDWITLSLSGHSLIVLFGGAFLIYTAIKEIYHMIGSDDLEMGANHTAQRSVATAILWILVMNIVFSFVTVLSAIALTDQFIVMTAAIVVSGVLMVVMSETVANFLKKNRMYEVLGLFVLLLVGIMLTTEGGHLAHLSFFGYPIEPMSKATFYFVLATLVIVEVIQTRYQRKLLRKNKKS